MEFQYLSEPDAIPAETDKLQITAAGKTIYPKSKSENRLFSALRTSEVPVLRELERHSSP